MSTVKKMKNKAKYLLRCYRLFVTMAAYSDPGLWPNRERGLFYSAPGDPAAGFARPAKFPSRFRRKREAGGSIVRKRCTAAQGR